MKRFLIFGGIAVVLAAVIIVMIQGATGKSPILSSSSRKTADTFAQAIVSGDTKKTYGMLSERAKKLYTEAAWKGQLNPVTGFYESANYKSVRDTAIKGEGTYGEKIYTYSAIGKDKSRHTFTIGVREEVDGKTDVSIFSATNEVANE